jgi:SAM-dependent methyltransferase
VLDAGCGVGGPAVDIASTITGVTIDAVTISPAQARCAAERTVAAGLAARIRIVVGDYHDLPFADASFDLVYFFESFGYSDDPPGLVAEVWRVLRPGGIVYLKDVFRPAGQLDPEEEQSLADFDRIYAQRTPMLDETAVRFEQRGFIEVATRDLTALVDRTHWGRAMGEMQDHDARLTPFGELHFFPDPKLRVSIGELRARRPG